MKQSMIAGFILCVIGLIMSASPDKIWEITEKWKSANAEKATDQYRILIRIISGLCVGAGVLLISGLLA